MFTVVRAGSGIVLMCAALAAAVGWTATQPAEISASGTQLEQCMLHCRATFTSIEQTLRLIDRSQSSQDPGELKRALSEARIQLVEMRKHMGSSMTQLEVLRNGSSPHLRTALALGESWACPMHRQVRQDRPGNCPICDVTLRSVPVGVASTQPSLAIGGADERSGDDYIRRSTTAR